MPVTAGRAPDFCFAAADVTQRLRRASYSASRIRHLFFYALGWAAWFTIGVIVVLLVALVHDVARPDLLMPPALLSAASSLDVAPEAFAVVVAASASVVTPIGYQTNLMVMSPGGYRFGDCTTVSGPLSVLVRAVTVAVVGARGV